MSGKRMRVSERVSDDFDMVYNTARWCEEEGIMEVSHSYASERWWDRWTLRYLIQGLWQDYVDSLISIFDNILYTTPLGCGNTNEMRPSIILALCLPTAVQCVSLFRSSRRSWYIVERWYESYILYIDSITYLHQTICADCKNLNCLHANKSSQSWSINMNRLRWCCWVRLSALLQYAVSSTSALHTGLKSVSPSCRAGPFQ